MRSPPRGAGHCGPLPGPSFQDQLALSRFAPGKTVGAKTPCDLRRWRRGGRMSIHPLQSLLRLRVCPSAWVKGDDRKALARRHPFQALTGTGLGGRNNGSRRCVLGAPNRALLGLP